ncbi:Protein MDT-26 a, partial [Aphelenchoides avenae]
SDTSTALDAISNLEKSTITKEVLEQTRIARTINELRKQIQDSNPEVAKGCRRLIKAWQKVAEIQRPPSSGSSSTNGTPRLISPAVHRGLTPHTPSRRVTSTGLQPPGTPGSATISPSQNGSYAPPTKTVSPLATTASVAATSLPKSYSVGAKLFEKAKEDVAHVSPPAALNGVSSLESAVKRKAETPPNGLSSIKRARTVAYALNSQTVQREASISPGSSSVVAARKVATSSTAQLLAQLSLPEHMAIDLSEHERKPSESKPIYTASTSYTEPLVTAREPVQSLTVKLKRKYTKRGAASTARLSEITEEPRTISHEPPRSSSNFELDEMLPSTSTAAASAAKPKEKRFSWYDSVPKLEDIARRKTEYARPHNDPQASFVMSIRERKVLALPYVDPERQPDFLEYKFPDPEQFLAKLNLE